MLDEKLLEALNIQMGNELRNSYHYKAFSGIADFQSLLGTCSWLEKQSDEEYGHFKKFYSYICDKGSIPHLQPLEEIPPQILTIDQIFSQVVALEHATYENLKILAAMCRTVEDDQTYELLLEFLKEQVEEVKTTEDILKRVLMSANNILLIDNELGER